MTIEAMPTEAMSIEANDMKSTIQRAAADAGFDLCGIAPASDSPELQRFPEWIAAGHAGEMKYMEARDEQGELKRGSLSRVAPWANSVIVCAINYNTDHPYSNKVNDPQRGCSDRGCSDRGCFDRGWISRYAWSHEDYHDAVLRRLQQVEHVMHDSMRQGQFVRQPDGRLCSSALTTRSYVDTGPIVERVYAKYAGIGWTGKNTCLIHQKKGSWLFLGVILASLELTPDFPAPDRCGICTRCLEACPTDAFLGPYHLDANKCIAYLTIEKRGAIPEELRSGIGHHVFGCDICQDVCPWNRKAPVSSAPEFQPRPGLVNPALAWLAEMTAEDFRETFRGSPVRRTKHSGLRRNVAIAMGNSGNLDFLPVLDRLAADQDESVADAAKWAIQMLESKKPDKTA